MSEFCPGQPPPNTPPGIDLWLLPIDTVAPLDLEPLRDCLSSSEQAHLEQMRLPQAQRRFLLSRGCLRHLLSRYTEASPGGLRFVYGPRGKPALTPIKPGGTVPQFNLSHSGHRLLIAVSLADCVTAVGVDVEALRSVSHLPALCRRYLTPTEAKTVLALAPPLADHRFLRYWTGKEACLKALGLGIVDDAMHTLELSLGDQVSPVPTPLPLTVHPLTARQRLEHPGQVYQWQPEAGYWGAIAVQCSCRDPLPLRLFTITPAALVAGATPEANTP
ncbi:4'-phosphopantetheinyl transferase family protein [Nodosilinea sp. E11]|uniref:4'-phosphopantetheinyl transferase family protein n=1 Tax=Nodosilinea sp. E11 TaxID=3037479 RepID=UPI0029343A12|nr:4'-phosphopantetheinyl transferase superfamily protein [Nodosilinea sp. E11]WOD38091.1 4'-phosphopantetheinyl transferase superfamily protein [Nodosilinea sp. E11]